MRSFLKENLESKDLIIRETCFEDLELFCAWEKLPEVTKFFSIGDDRTKEDLYHEYFNALDDSSTQQFTVLLKSEDAKPRIIGRVILGDIIHEWKAEVWRIYIADPALRGKGYGRQTLELMVKHCFETLKLERVYLDHYTGNPAEYLYKNVGFQPEGCLRGNCRKNGVLYDVHLLSMLRAEYEERYR